MGGLKSILKKCLPSALIRMINRVYAKSERVKISFSLLMARNYCLASLYYCFFSSQMRREFYSVLQGKLRYYNDLKQPTAGLFLLRRNIHRLEKGLIMKPRRDIFARDYITETVNAYIQATANPSCEKSAEMQWFHSVLLEYFSVVKSDAVIDKARCLFEQQQALSDGSMIPYCRDLNKGQMGYDDFMALCMRRRSVRWFKQEPVPRDLIDNAILAAAQSPSACNRQPFRFHIIDEPELLQKVASVPGGTIGFHHNFPAFIAVIGQLRAYFHERDRHVIYIDASLASMSFLFALETQGLSSCIINWPDVEEREVRMSKLLNLEADERVIMLIALGWPDEQEKVPFSHKKSLDVLRSYN